MTDSKKPYFQNEGHTIYHGDVLENLYHVPRESVHLVVTSPPYNSNKAYGDKNITIDDNKAYAEYLQWLWDVFDQFLRVLVDGGRVCININDQGRDPYYPIHAEVMKYFSDHEDWVLRGNIVWDKIMAPSTTAWGSWESASAPSLRGSQEYIIVASKYHSERWDKRGKESGPFGPKEFMSLTDEMWRFHPVADSRHPAPFPPALPERCIKLFSFKGDTILDPFCGTGTTLKEAKLLGRKSIGIDGVEKYCEMSATSLRQDALLDLSKVEGK